jgi:hypothetical protein
MTTISTYALEPPSSKQIKASRPLDEAMNSCLRAKSTGQYNLGMLAEVSGSRSVTTGCAHYW